MQNDFPLLSNFFTNVLEFYKEGQHVRWSEIKPNSQQQPQKDYQDDDDDEFLISAFKSSVAASNSSISSTSNTTTTVTPCLYFVISNLADVHLVGALRADEMVATQRTQLAEKQIPEESMCEKVKNCCYSSSTENQQQQQNLNLNKNNIKSVQQGEGYSCKFLLFDDDDNVDDRAKKGENIITRKGKLVFKITTVFKVVESIHASFTLEADLFDVHDLLRQYTSKTDHSEQRGNIIPRSSSTSALFIASSNVSNNNNNKFQEKTSSSKNRHHFVREYFIRPLLKQLSLMKSIAATGFALSCAKSEENEEAVLVSLERHQQALLKNHNHHHHHPQKQQKKTSSADDDIVPVPPIANNVARTYVEDAISWHRSLTSSSSSQQQQQRPQPQQQQNNPSSISTIKLFSQFTTSSTLSNITDDRSHNDRTGLTAMKDNATTTTTTMRDNINILSRHVQVELLASDAFLKNANNTSTLCGDAATRLHLHHHNQQRRQRENANDNDEDDDFKFLMMLDGGGKNDKTKNDHQNQKQNLKNLLSSSPSSSSSSSDDDDEESKKRRQHLQQQRKYDLRRL